MRNEISANIKFLYMELQAREATAENVQALYVNTEFFKKYKSVIDSFNRLQTLDDNEWEKLRNVAQSHGFYKEAMTLNTTQDNSVFKKHFVVLINRMIEYTENSIKHILKRF